MRSGYGYVGNKKIKVSFTKSGEMKTKPTQHSVKTLQENGLQPDILVLRSEHSLGDEIKRKVALFCNVEPDAVVESLDMPTIYEVPLRMYDQHLDTVALKKLGLSDKGHAANLDSWRAFVDRVKNPEHNVHIALVGTKIKMRLEELSEQ